jgi:hypothetical protein
MKQLVIGNLCLFSLAVRVPADADGGRAFGAELPKAGGMELKYEDPKVLRGSIYLQPFDGKKLLFNFQRVANRSGTTLRAQRSYTYPDGRLAVRERVVYEGDALVAYELEDLQTGAVGSARIRHAQDMRDQGNIRFQYRKRSGDRLSASTEDLRENTLIDDMVGPFLASHWDELVRGEAVHCRLIVVAGRETVRFTFVKTSAPAGQGGDALTVRMEASSPFVAALVDPLVFKIEKAPPHHILQYFGRTTPKIQAGSKWNDLDAVTVFDLESAH